MITRLIKHFVRRIDAAKAENDEIMYRRGYDWCAGAILRGEMDAQQVEAMVECSMAFEGKRDPFDAGVDAALHRLAGLDVQ